ncbi:hypothetical protein [Brevibacillus sedimenti]|uniref:hypothetical protein n=1 Tax=Brevibacillus sedimenti TaxID=2613334 RepID=UPI002DD7CFC1|nr:hypothetical protein [Anoxybacillus sediminis]
MGGRFGQAIPAAALGVQYLQDVKAPFPHIPIIPTGGIDEHNVAAFIEAGAAAVGIGGKLLDRRAIAAGDFAAVEQTARTIVDAVRRARVDCGKSA